MKNHLFILVGILFTANLFAQNDTAKTKELFIKPFCEIGLSYTSNSHIEDSYYSNSMFNWGIGVRFGNSNINNVLPFAQYSNSLMEKASSTLTIQEVKIGVDAYIKRMKSGMFKIKAAAIYSIIDDDLSNIVTSKGGGLQIGLGYEIKILKSSRVSIDYSYNLTQLTNSSPQNYDIHKITIGFIL